MLKNVLDAAVSTVCPSDTMRSAIKKAVVSELESLNCDRAAVCPTGAITVTGLDPAATQFQNFSEKTNGLRRENRIRNAW
ncbi:MAG: hypothetical protein R2875_12155 [Desulfobacterales bacterium]